jgi:hypothetical protein
MDLEEGSMKFRFALALIAAAPFAVTVTRMPRQ